MAPGLWIQRIEDLLPDGVDPRGVVVFWALVAQTPILTLCAAVAAFTGPALGAVGLLATAFACLALIATGRTQSGAWLAVAANLAVYGSLSPGVEAGHASMMSAIPVMVVLAAFALGWRQALLVSGLGIAAHSVLAVSALSSHPIGLSAPWVHMGQSGMLLEITLLAGLASHRLHAALDRATASEHALQKALADRDNELELRRAADIKLTEALSSAKSASDAKSRFLANMSHELRTPLNAILGYAEMLGEEIDPRETGIHHDLGRIVHAGKNLLTLINDVLDLSKIEAGRLDLLYETFDVKGLVEELVAAARPLAERNHNALALSVPSPLGELYGDPARVRQIMLNLLSNAAKFTSDGRIELTVLRQIGSRGAEELRFEVRDTGIGISPQTLPRLFQPFMQADNTTSRKFGGTGLGLGLASRLAQMMYGTLEVQSKLAEGSTFTFTLPILSHAGRMAALRARRVEEAPTAGRPVVLCVDDEVAALDLLDRTLFASGMHPIPISDPRQALDLARTLQPAVITLDVRMPEIDGLTLLGQLKASPELARIPVVMVSIHDEAYHGYKLGAADYLPKPINRARLVAVVARLARGEGPILVVEDDPETRQIFRQTLCTAGYEVVECENGVQAIRELERSQPRAMLLDLMMPEMDGYTVAERMRDNPSWAGIPIIVVTAAELGPDERERLGHCVGLYSKARGLDAVIDQIKRHAA